MSKQTHDDSKPVTDQPCCCGQPKTPNSAKQPDTSERSPTLGTSFGDKRFNPSGHCCCRTVRPVQTASSTTINLI